MQASAFWKAVTMDQVDLLDRVLSALERHEIRFCVVGGQAVNAYVEPVVSLDLDLALAAGAAAGIERLFAPPVRIERFPHSLNVSAPGSDLRVQFQTDPRYQSFPLNAERREILGRTLPVARVEDVLQGKVWAASDASRRASKRQKDLADIARLLEEFPRLRGSVPEAILQRLVG
jgi:hypothetical protein